MSLREEILDLVEENPRGLLKILRQYARELDLPKRSKFDKDTLVKILTSRDPHKRAQWEYEKIRFRENALRKRLMEFSK